MKWFKEHKKVATIGLAGIFLLVLVLIGCGVAFSGSRNGSDQKEQEASVTDEKKDTVTEEKSSDTEVKKEDAAKEDVSEEKTETKEEAKKEEKTEKDGACAPRTQVNINDITAPVPAGGGGGMQNVRRFAQMEDGALKKATFSDNGGGCSLICQMWGRCVKSAPYLVKK